MDACQVESKPRISKPEFYRTILVDSGICFSLIKLYCLGHSEVA